MQRKPLSPVSSASKQENVGVASRRKPLPLCRPAHVRLCDRWPMLGKILRSSKSSTIPSSLPRSDGCDEFSGDEGYSTSVKVDERHAFGRPQVLRHSASPKFPSLLSGNQPMKRTLLARHNYIHRGYSQSALQLQRVLWYKRRSDWLEYECALRQASLTSEDAYGGILELIDFRSHSPPHYQDVPWSRVPKPFSLQCSKMDSCAPTFPNIATFPRLGDLSSLRDPFMISVDTWFSDFPVWTLSKMTWLYDANYRAIHSSKCHRRKASNVVLNDDFYTANASAETLSDASDLTLVDASTDVSPLLSGLSSIQTHSRDVHKIGQPTDSARCFMSVESSLKPWETSWLSRWEVLYNQVRLALELSGFSAGLPFSVADSKAATRMILTSSGILYDPYRDSLEDLSNEDDDSEFSSSSNRHALASEEDDADYGMMVPLNEPVYRLGAHVNPFSMFDTATTEYDSAVDRISDAGACLPGGHDTEIIEAFQRLSLDA